jgi:hypothetical protein
LDVNRCCKIALSELEQQNASVRKHILFIAV